MDIKSILKNEGIKVTRELNKIEVKTIAKDISIKLCLAFPEQNLSRTSLFKSLSSIKMYLATLPKDFSGAKYVLNNNSIYFNNALPFEEIPNTAMHECIHFIQHNNKNSFGLSQSAKETTLNEAAVQLMASEANMNSMVDVKYFDICLKTISPDYYPLECSILNQIIYFTGSYPLYNSVLYSNEIFKNTFIRKFNKKMYSQLVSQLYKIQKLENEFAYYSTELVNETNTNTIKKLNKFINYKKQKIKTLFFQTQNYIIKNCFNYEFNTIRTLKDIHEFKNKLYKFKDVMSYTDNYSFYNDYYRSMMNALVTKKEQIIASGKINLFAPDTTSLVLIDTRKSKIGFIKTFYRKLKELIKTEVSKEYINE